ncbi:MAG: hypothetical protein NTV57_16595 [Cyanobacteria bacterium]|nr:hypothetical protein [Cyanobacteriota bacterium]
MAGYVRELHDIGRLDSYSMHHPPEVSEHERHAWAEGYLTAAGVSGSDRGKSVGLRRG